MSFFLVGLGGIFGGLCRFRLGKFISQKSKLVFPIGTFIINITGAMLLGILNSISVEKNLYLLMGDGFLGAFTTFSTFMYEGLNLIQQNKKMRAIIYIFSTLFLGILGYIIGYTLGV